MKSSFTADQINFIKRKAATLPELEEEIISAIFWNGCTEWDLSKKFGISPYEVFAIKKRALKLLKKIYKKEFVGNEPMNWWKITRALV